MRANCCRVSPIARNQKALVLIASDNSKSDLSPTIFDLSEDFSEKSMFLSSLIKSKTRISTIIVDTPRT